MNDFIEKLHSYHLFTLQSRIYNQLLMFSHSIKTSSRAPVELRSHIDLPAPDDDLVNQTDQTQEVYSLRRGRTMIKNKIPETKYDTLTFKHFFPKLLKSCKHLDFAVSKDSFSTQINLNLNDNLNIFLAKFPKFPKLNTRPFFEKKRKKWENSKGTKYNEQKFIT